MKSFKDWLLQFVKEDSITGDLARDIELDNCFPNNSRDYNTISEHLSISHNACYSVVKTLDEVFDQYKEYLGGLK